MAKAEFDELMSIGIDIGKDTFHLVGFDPTGQRVLRKQIQRLALVATFEKLPRCIVLDLPCVYYLKRVTGLERPFNCGFT